MVEAAELPARADAPRHEEPHPPADPGRARQELRPAGSAAAWAAMRAAAGSSRVADLHDPDQARQPARRARDPPPDPPRAAPCRRASSRCMKNEQLAGLEQGKSDPMRSASTTSSGCCRTIPPTTSATSRRSTRRSSGSRTSTDRPGPHALPRLPGRRATASWRSSATSSLPRSSPSSTGPSRAGRTRKPYARIERPFQPDLKPAKETIETPDKANAMLLRGPDRLPMKDDRPRLPGAGRRQLHPRRRLALVADRRPAAAEGRAVLHGRRRSSRPARSTPGPT